MAQLGYASNFGSGHDTKVRGFKRHAGLCADSSEPGACFRFCVSLSLPLSHLCSVSLCLSKINKRKKKIKIKKDTAIEGTCMAQTVERPALGFHSGHDLMVCGVEPHIALCADSSEPGACFGFCVSLSL